jgi:branched-subunit amino acid ABC-type transport system permease component
VLIYVITGLVTGSLYGLVAMGLVLTYRTSGVFNFGHGAIAAAAAYSFYDLHVVRGFSWPIAALVVVALFTVVVGALMELLTRGLGRVPEAVVVVATVGLMVGIQGLLFLIFGSQQKVLPPYLPQTGFTVNNVNITWAQVISVAIATTSALGLYLFLRFSRLGISMRAVVDNPSLTALSGDKPVRIRQVSWMIGSGFAAMSGILLAPTLGLDANLLTLLVVQAFGACAIGLFSNLPMTYLGGLIVGVLASLASYQFQSGAFRGLPSAVPFLVLFLVLILVPTRKLPRRRADSGSLIAEIPPLPKAWSGALAVAAVLVLMIVPHVVGVKLASWTAAGTLVLLFSSLALLVWVSGQISLCHAALVALGATNMAHLLDGGVPWVPALLLAGLLTVPAGLVVALPAIRLSGLYLALATLGFGIFLQQVVYPSFLMFGSLGAIDGRRPSGFESDTSYYYVVMTVAVVGCIGMALIYRSRLGRMLRGLSESPTMLMTSGLNVNMARVVVLCISAFYAGIAGALALAQFGSAGGVGYGPMQSLIYLAVLAICGTRLLPSSILAAALFALLPGYLGSFDATKQLFYFGVLAILASILVANRATLWSRLVASAAPPEGWSETAPTIARGLRTRATSGHTVASPPPPSARKQRLHAAAEASARV